MAISSTTTKIPYVLTSGTQTLPVPFYFLESTHLKVIKDGNPSTVLTLETHYKVAGAGLQGGGSIVLTGVATAAGDSITIQRQVPITQLVDYVYNDKFNAEVHERALDKLTMIAQQNAEEVSRALRFEAGENIDGTLVRETRKGKGLGFNIVDGAVEFFEVQDVIDAAASAEAAAAAAAGGAGIWVERSTNFVAANDAYYRTTATLTVTNPSPVQGKGYIVDVRNGRASIGGREYVAPVVVRASYHAGAWSYRGGFDEDVGELLRSRLNTVDVSNLGLKLKKVGPVVTKNAGEAFRAGLVESPCVFWDPADGYYHMLFTAYTAGNVEASIGHAFSLNLVNWTVDPFPFFQKSGVPGATDEFGTTSPVLVIRNGVYHLFYTGLTAPGYEAGTKRMHLATAPSLFGPWTRRGVVIAPGAASWRSVAIWHPTIVERRGTFYMFFNATGSDFKERIGYATSPDLLTWTVQDATSPLIDINLGLPWKAGIVGDPVVYQVGDYWVMTYFGFGFGAAHDAIAYTTDAAFPLGWYEPAYNPTLSGTPGGFDQAFAHKPYLFFKGGKRFHYYTFDEFADFTSRGIALCVDDTPEEDIRLAEPNEIIQRTITPNGAIALPRAIETRNGFIIEEVMDAAGENFRLERKGTPQVEGRIMLRVPKIGGLQIPWKGTLNDNESLSVGDLISPPTGIDRAKIVLGNTSGDRTSEVILGQSNDRCVILGWTGDAIPGNAYAVLETYASANTLRLNQGGGLVQFGNNMESLTNGGGIILRSPNGTRYLLTVTNAGTLSIAPA